MTHEALWKKETGGNGARFDVGERGDGAVDRKEMQFYVQFFLLFFFSSSPLKSQTQSAEGQ